MNKKRILILGSTGSIGRQSLEVLAQSEAFELAGIAAGSNAALLLAQCAAFSPRFAALSSPPEGFSPPKGLRMLLGEGALLEACEQDGIDCAIVAVVGAIGLRAVLRLLDRGIPVLLANKETLVAGGELVMRLAVERRVPLLPVDSEHSAIFQCLRGAEGNPPKTIWLTASGGPFRAWPKAQIEGATLEQALRHPNWSMGPKISIDSASMMNKALEIIEAKALFQVEPDQIEVLVHPESIVHSAVEFSDGSVLAQMGRPDMRLPIAYALSFPKRMPLPYPSLSLVEIGALHFERPDFERFPALRLAYRALEIGGVAPAALNAANEAAVELFIAGRIPFGEIARRVENALERVGRAELSLAHIELADAEARRLAMEPTGR
ncbi:MAG: 1-deoxy-D-xylulose-5-phosphate reductoisomerase [Christensenellaceae bacterium]|jgi:1-deoxy-D-xylulose-5-phosphate reductoisomerase|nr:1-deoxy-D-xylulose-5-phosphate reductoisomerase [Christensenellaceae bacterium]